MSAKHLFEKIYQLTACGKFQLADLSAVQAGAYVRLDQDGPEAPVLLVLRTEGAGKVSLTLAGREQARLPL